jgi:Arm DNA-binding domain
VVAGGRWRSSEVAKGVDWPYRDVTLVLPCTSAIVLCRTSAAAMRRSALAVEAASRTVSPAIAPYFSRAKLPPIYKSCAYESSGGTWPGLLNRLSGKFVEKVKTAGVYRDGTGLLLRVEESGSKRWVLRTTVKGRRRDIGLGSADQVSLKDVREEARDLPGPEKIQ